MVDFVDNLFGWQPKICWYNLLFVDTVIEILNLIFGFKFRDNNYHLIGNSLRLNRELVRGCTPRYNFLINRIENDWNVLQEEIVRAKNLNSFKVKTGEWLKRKLLLAYSGSVFTPMEIFSMTAYQYYYYFYYILMNISL